MEIGFEPVGALDGGSDGLDLIRRLLQGLPDALAPGGAAFLEMGADQAELLSEVAAELLAKVALFDPPGPRRTAQGRPTGAG